jgi:hypothetical protein
MKERSIKGRLVEKKGGDIGKKLAGKGNSKTERERLRRRGKG